MAAGPGMGTNHSRGIRRGAEPYAVRGSSGVAAGPAPNRRFLAPDGRAASDRARRRAEHQPRFDCSARFARSARIALGLPPTSSSLAQERAPPLAPPQLVCRHTRPFPVNLVSGLRVTTAAETILAAARDLGVLDLVILGDSALRLRHCTLTDLEIAARQRRRSAPLLRQVNPAPRCAASPLGSRLCACCTR